MTTIIDILNDNAGEFCNKPILRFKNLTVPYSQVLVESDKFAQALRNLNFQPGDNVVVLLPNIPEVFIAYYGCLKARCRVIPLSIYVRTHDLKFIFESADIKGIVFWDKYERKVMSLLEQLHLDVSLIQVGNRFGNEHHFFSEVLEASESISVNEYPDDEDAAVILFSSGTTGIPKGAVLTHTNIRMSAQAIIEYFQLSSNDKITGVVPINHYLGQAFIMHAALMCGAEIHLYPYFEAEAICKSIYEHKATIFVGTTSMYNALLELPAESNDKLSSLKFGVVSGYQQNTELFKNFREKFTTPVIQGYGGIETTSIIASTGTKEMYSNSIIGKPFNGIEIKIVDEDGRELFPGEVGEIMIKSPMNMKGYFNDSEGDDVQKDNAWVFPGDLCMWNEKGDIEFIGHVEDRINRGSFSVYPKEIESCLLNHPDVKEAAVIGVQDKDHIEEIKAYLILKQGVESAHDSIHHHCVENLPKYKCPKYIEFVDTMPKDYSGSIIRRFLK